ncbi:MAG: 23S rRNA (uracil(1939)-C(5))-methyltransferase RlmD [Lachnospiraceae bacterium]|nr:23S rRNA (uracil(1939)-C(5))-methyltransferase RlmD [Lachnospiraceae bacterium]
MQFIKNQQIRLEITDLNTDGEGIGKVDGFPFFMKDAVPGDVVTATVMRVKKNYGYARMQGLLSPSPYRVVPVCPQHKACGGCQLQTLSYEKQMEFKEKKIANNLCRIGGLSAEEVEKAREPFVGMEEPFHYRNKAQYPVGKDREGKVICGFYAGRTHSIVANTDCSLGAEENGAILRAVMEHMERYQISPYNEATGQGLVRHILIRTGFESRQVMVCLVVNLSSAEWEKYGQERLKTEALVGKLRGLSLDGDCSLTCPEDGEMIQESGKGVPDGFEKGEITRNRPGKICSIAVNLNIRRDNVIMGDECRTLWGSDTIEDRLFIRDVSNEFQRTGDFLTFKISPLSFYQVNPRQTEKLYSIALDYAALTGSETVWDLYCGIGTISLFMARRAGQICGVEVVPQAIEDARTNAALNGITNATFYVGKAEEVLPAFYKEHGNDTSLTHPDVIVVDPPRKGCDSACLDTMLQMQPDRIVYVSCDSATLARDVRYLCEGGYELRRWRGVDQFGQTVHVETVVLMSRIDTQ